MVELLSRLAVALAIGLLVGLERGWKSRDEQEGRRAAGFRTFALTGLLGGVSGIVADATHPMVLGFLSLGYIGAFASFHYLEARETGDLSVTSVVAGMLTFALGAYAALGELQVAIAAAVSMVLLLALRQPLHEWVEKLREEEIRAVLTLLAMSFLLLPVLPNRTIDPWGSINPYEIWLLAIMIAAISFGGYVAMRVFGERLGVMMAALVGGLASSTATTLTLARLGEREPASDRLLSGGILMAGVVMVVRVGVVAFLLNRALIPSLVLPLASVAAVLLAAAALLIGRRSGSTHPEIEMANPLQLGTALKLAAVIAVVMLASAVARHYLGSTAVLGVAALSGITDVDAVTISMARLAGNQLDMPTATLAIALAVGVNSMAKAAMAGWIGGWRMGGYVGLASVLALAAGGAVMAFH
ncbi:MAG: MgtC/SapB family protein [Sphingomonadaceae bacterium]